MRSRPDKETRDNLKTAAELAAAVQSGQQQRAQQLAAELLERERIRKQLPQR